jgi:hypothetical protein
MDADSQLQRAADMTSASSPPVQAATTQQRGNKTVKISMEAEAAALKMLQEEARKFEKEARVCPIPKPSGWIGRVLGFEESGPGSRGTSISAR